MRTPTAAFEQFKRALLAVANLHRGTLAFNIAGEIPPCLALVLVASLFGCSATTPTLDPFNRPYSPENMLEPIEIKGCSPRPVDKVPRLLFGTRPLYPMGEELAGRSGGAMLRFEVSEVGEVKPISADAENKWFASHALIAMRDWKFSPAESDGKPVPVVCRLKLDYLTYREAERRGLTKSTP